MDPVIFPGGPIYYQSGRRSLVRPLNLPFGTNASADVLRQMIEPPPMGEDTNSGMGPYRYFNKADIIITVTDTNISATTGAFDDFATSFSPQSFLTTNAVFFDRRENANVVATEMDVGKFREWSSTNASVRPLIGRDVFCLYISDERTIFNSGILMRLAAVRLVNGQRLPPLGLTVATPNPLYVKGDFNVTTNGTVLTLDSTNPANTFPASLVADAITILSSNWDDANSTCSLHSRTARDTTINAAVIAGIVPSDGTNSSGSINNMPRLLETWTGRTFTWNSSVVVLFYSSRATGKWGGSDIYSPPVRNWTFDQNFLNSSKLPPGAFFVGEVDSTTQP